MLTTLLFLAQLQAPLRSEPVRLVREIQAELDRNGGHALERVWRATLRQRPADPRAMLAVATFERNRYRYAPSESLLVALERSVPADDPWQAMSRVGRAAWRALGTDVAMADSLLTQARAIAQRASARDVEAEAVLLLSGIRSRTRGPRAGLQLLGEWWGLLPSPAPADSALHECQRGVLSDQLGDTTASAKVLAAVQRARALRSWRVAGNCSLALAQAQDRRGFTGAAMGAARLAIEDFERADYTIGVALASQWYGYVLVQGNLHGKGKDYLERAIVAARVTGFESVAAWAESSLAQLYLNAGDLTLARRYAERAAASHQRRGDGWGLANTRRLEASALEASGDLMGAIERNREAEQAYRAAGLPLNGLPALIARANLYLRLGWLDSAERVITEGRQVGRASDAWLRNEEPVLRGVLALKQGQLALAESLFLANPYSRLRPDTRNQTTAMIVALREAQVAYRRGKVAQGDSAVDFFQRRMAVWRRAVNQQGMTAGLAQISVNTGGLTEIYPDLVAVMVEQGRVAQAFELVESIRSREVLERRLRASALDDSAAAAAVLRRLRSEAPIATLAEVRKGLGADEALVTFVAGLDDAPTTALVVTRESVRTLRLPGSAPLKPDVERFLQLAARGTEAVAASRRLGAALMQPVVGSLPPSITRIAISPDGLLHRIPFDALRLPDDQYVMQRFAVSMAPSASALLALRGTSSSPGAAIVAVGDPAYPQGARGDEGEPREAPRRGSLPRLVHSRAEAAMVARFGAGATLLVGRRATERQATRAMQEAGVIHLAVHGLVDDASQANTALALAPGDGQDGFLTPAEIAQLTLRNPLVVLSACRSSGGAVLGGEGLQGLTSPLLQAGARAVVGTWWSIGDRSVVPFVERFYRGLAAGQRADDALREAKLAAMRDGVSIADWGSYAITGDGGMRLALRAPARREPAPWLRNIAQVLRDTSGS